MKTRIYAAPAVKGLRVNADPDYKPTQDQYTPPPAPPNVFAGQLANPEESQIAYHITRINEYEPSLPDLIHLEISWHVWHVCFSSEQLLPFSFALHYYDSVLVNTFEKARLG